jgi:hypothetical protein
MISDSVVTQIVKNVNGEVTEDKVRQVFAAYEAIMEGATVGTVMQDPKTGSVAVRCSENGVPRWKVSAVTGDDWVDMQPRLEGWTVLHDPEAASE